MSNPPAVTLELIMKKNKEEADKLLKEAKKLLDENRHISVEMAKVMPPAPASSQSPGRYSSVADSVFPQSSQRPDPMGGLLHAADALVRSWKRRHKKNFKQLELDLMTALERVNGRP